jgi:hypothetical protein
LKNEVALEVNHPKMIQQIRNKIAEDIARKHIRKYFVKELNSTLGKDSRKIEVSLEVINPIKDVMSLFRRTKVKGWMKKYRENLLTLVKVLSEMHVTPDLALISQILVWKGNFLDEEQTICEVALVEIKRGKAGLNYFQKKDVEKAKEAGIPYYLLRVDDSDFLHGKFKLTLEPLTPNLLTCTPK